MKIISLLTLLCMNTLLFHLEAQTPAWEWGISGIGNEIDESSAVTADVNGNVIVTGYFASDSITFGSTTLQNSGPTFDESYIAKYDSSGNFLWAHAYGSSNDDKGTAITTDVSGNIYLAGYFYSPTITFGTYTLTNAGTVGDIFLVKFDPAGNVLWAKREGGPSQEIPFAVNIDVNGNIVMAGRFSSLSLTFGTYTLTQAGSMDAFIVKYDNGGNVLWATGAGGGSNDEAYAMDTDGSGNIFVAGHFNQTATFGIFSLTTAGLSDCFYAKINPAGVFQWAVRAGGNADDRVTDLEADANGNIYLTGYFNSPSISFGLITLNNTVQKSSFIVKIDNAGNSVWANAVHGNCQSNGITVSGNNVISCGTFYGDTLTFGSSQLLREGTADIFLVNSDLAGNATWALKQTSGGLNSELATTICSDVNGNIFTGGYFKSSPISFGASVLNNTDNGFDMFVAKLGNVSTGITEQASEFGPLLFPNPAGNNVSIRHETGINAVYIYNILGMKVYTLEEDGKPTLTSCNLTSLSKGIYIVLIDDGRQLFTRRLIVE